LARKINIEDLNTDIQFQVELQIALRQNASRIMEYYDNKERFQNYIRQREEKIALILGEKELFEIFKDRKKIFP
jgi:hypothetical protein